MSNVTETLFQGENLYFTEKSCLKSEVWLVQNAGLHVFLAIKTKQADWDSISETILCLHTQEKKCKFKSLKKCEPIPEASKHGKVGTYLQLT